MKPARATDGISRRSLLVGGLALPLAGCTAPYGMDFKTLKTSVAVAVGLEDAPGITIKQASEVPYATIGLRIGSSGERMMVLATDHNGERLWTSSERQALVTRGGRLVKTAGFRWNLTNTRFSGIDPLVTGLQHGIPEQPVQRIMDFNDIHRYGVMVNGQFEQKSFTTITVLGAELPTLMIAEHCRSDDLDWEFVNVFWIDRDSGFVWRSKQTIHPNLPPFTISVLRAPS